MSGHFALHHLSTQHPIGQGFFYSADLHHCAFDDLHGYRPRSANFAEPGLRYVYDCGSSSDLATLHTEASGLFGGSDAGLDYVFVSHLHEDHVNGLKILLAGRHVDTIVLPLLSAVERVLAFLQSYDSFAAAEASRTADPWYLAFIANPVDALRDFEPRRIIFVRGDGDGALPADDLPEPGDPEAQLESPNVRWTERIVGPRPQPVQNTSGAETAQVFEINRGSAICVGSAVRPKWWLFAPYVILGDDERLHFREAMVARFADSDIDRELGEPDFLRSLLVDRASFARLKDAYVDVVGARNLNLTSLSLLSAPLSTSYESFYSIHIPNKMLLNGVNPGRGGWLGTGDSDLKEDELRASFLSYFARYTGRIRVMSAPHHGSCHNFHRELVDRIGPDVVVGSSNYKYKNYRHPHPSVVTETCAAGAFMWVTSEDPASQLNVEEWFYFQ